MFSLNCETCTSHNSQNLVPWGLMRITLCLLICCHDFFALCLQMNVSEKAPHELWKPCRLFNSFFSTFSWFHKEIFIVIFRFYTTSRVLETLLLLQFPMRQLKQIKYNDMEHKHTKWTRKLQKASACRAEAAGGGGAAGGAHCLFSGCCRWRWQRSRGHLHSLMTDLRPESKGREAADGSSASSLPSSPRQLLIKARVRVRLHFQNSLGVAGKKGDVLGMVTFITKVENKTGCWKKMDKTFWVLTYFGFQLKSAIKQRASGDVVSNPS